jgi:hypothetical protein
MPIEPARDELAAALASSAPQIEGLEDFLRLNLLPEAQAEVSTAHMRVQQRRDLETAALVALNALLADGYPAPIIEEVPGFVIDNLVEQQTTLQAAIKHFTPLAPATSFDLTAGKPTPK